MPSGSRDQQIIDQLRMTLEKAREAFHAAAAEHDAILSEIPSGLPYVDGAFQVHQASEKFRQAIRAYSRAVYRYDDFIRTGILPDESDTPKI
jgi:prephenate dehydrogenase